MLKEKQYSYPKILKYYIAFSFFLLNYLFFKQINFLSRIMY